MKNIHKIKIVDGIYELFDKIRLLAFKACIVTNCNRKVATAIIDYIKIDKKIDAKTGAVISEGPAAGKE